MNFTDLNLSTEQLTSVNTFTYQSNNITVRKYLPVEDKLDLIAITLQKAEENGVYNELLLDVFFHLNIIYLYTNIEFSMEDREDELELYDILETNDIINQVVANMDEDEYRYLKEVLEISKQETLEYTNTAAAVIQRIVQDLPKNAAAAKEIVDNFDPSQYQAVVDFATAANGGRNINTQTAPVSAAVPQEKEVKAVPKRKIVSIDKTSALD